MDEEARGGDREDAARDELLAFGLATFHATLFLAAFVLVLHLQGATEGLFASLNTAVGLGLGVLLWGLTWWTTRRALDGLDPGRMRVADVLARGGTWGGVTGGLFVATAVVGAAVLSGELGLLLFGVFGGAFAVVVGAVVGMAAALVDLGLAALARGLATAGRSP